MKKFILSVFILFFAGYAISPLSCDLYPNKAERVASKQNSSNETLRLLVGDLIATKLPHRIANKTESHILLRKVRALTSKIFSQCRPAAALFAILFMLAWSSPELLNFLCRKTKTQAGFGLAFSGLSPPQYSF